MDETTANSFIYHGPSGFCGKGRSAASCDYNGKGGTARKPLHWISIGSVWPSVGTKLQIEIDYLLSHNPVGWNRLF